MSAPEGRRRAARSRRRPLPSRFVRVVMSEDVGGRGCGLALARLGGSATLIEKRLKKFRAMGWGNGMGTLFRYTVTHVGHLENENEG